MIFSKRIETAFLEKEKIRKVEDLSKFFDSKTHQSLYSPVFRMIECYKNRNEKDFVVNLRQCAMYSNTRIHLPFEALKICKKYETEYGLYVDPNLEWVEAKPYAMEECEDLKYTYVMKKRRILEPTMTDSAMINYFGYNSYVSLQQKCMIYISKQLKKGECYLACIPTGSGKSLLWQSAVARGQFAGVTVVVVPTIALALDHKKSDDKIMKRMPWVESIAYTSKEYTGSQEKIEQLKEKIVNGKQKILYISPEGLTNPEIKRALEDAAKRKNISAIIVDETHLVVDWGMNFRPEFQFLPALIDNLKVYSENEIITVLLSATLTETDIDVLENLFGRNGMIEFRGDELRSEIEYYSQYCKTETERSQYIRKLIKTVPRPAIVYVGTVEQSENIYELITSEGFSRVGLFHSKIKDREKERLLESWENNHIDIMVATSAFGMGVDKSDVRTVITAYTPENISRFYQEVGRSGRDGYTALSFSLFCPTEDSSVIGSYTDRKVIRPENLVKRWRAMVNNNLGIDEYNGSNVLWIDTDIAPQHLEFKETGVKNSIWNEDAVSMLVRAGLIRILDVRRSYKSNHKSFLIKVEINNDYIAILENDKNLLEFISKFRDLERQNIKNGIKTVKNMYRKQKSTCISDYLRDEFVYATSVCSGCPYCRKMQMKDYMDKGEITLYMDRDFVRNRDIVFQNGIAQCIEKNSLGSLVYENRLDDVTLNKIVTRLIMNQANLIIMEHQERLDLDLISMIPNDNYMILTLEEFLRIPSYLVFGTIVFFLEYDEEKNQEILELVKNYRYNEELNQILIAPERYYDKVEERYLSDYTEYGKKIKVLLQEEAIC